MRLAFIGGNGHHYLRGLLSQPLPERPGTVHVAATTDNFDTDASRRFAARLTEHDWFDDPMRMLDSWAPDIVSIGAVYALNAQWILQCLKRGIPVVSDKPIAATWEALEQIQALTGAAGAPAVITEFDFRARPEVRAARLAVQRGDVGTVALVSAQKSYRFGARPRWYAQREVYGGTILWIASHGIDAIRFTTGLEAVAVTGVQGNVTRADYGTMEDQTVNLYQLSNGASAIVHADLLRAKAAETHGDDRLRIVGSLGTLEMIDRKTFLTTHEGPRTDISAAGQADPLAWQLARAALGQTSDAFSTGESLATARLLLHSRDAADQRTWIDLR